MADSTHRTALVVAVIGVVGTLGAALIANWDKVSGRAPPAPPAAAVASPAAVVAAAPAAGPARASIPTLSGDWRDSGGPLVTTRVDQDGSSFRFARRGSLINGTGFESIGTGSVSGQQLVARYEARYSNGARSSGRCTGSVAADASQLDMSCTDSLLGPFASVSVRQ